MDEYEPHQCSLCSNNGNEYCLMCDDGDRFKAINNYARIVTMPLDNLAEFLADIVKHGGLPFGDNPIRWLRWLEEEGDDDG